MESRWIKEVSIQFLVPYIETEAQKIPFVDRNIRYPIIPSIELLEGRRDFVDLSKIYYDLKKTGWDVVVAERRMRVSNLQPFNHSVVFSFERSDSKRIDRRIRDRPGVINEAFLSFAKAINVWAVRVYHGEHDNGDTIRFVVKPQKRRYQQDQEVVPQLLRVLDGQMQYQTQTRVQRCETSSLGCAA